MLRIKVVLKITISSIIIYPLVLLHPVDKQYTLYCVHNANSVQTSNSKVSCSNVRSQLLYIIVQMLHDKNIQKHFIFTSNYNNLKAENHKHMVIKIEQYGFIKKHFYFLEFWCIKFNVYPYGTSKVCYNSSQPHWRTLSDVTSAPS